MRKFWIASLALALACSAAWAHRVRVFAVVQGAKVLCRGYVATGEPTRRCRVSVELPDGTVVAEGETDDNGEFAFVASRRADHTVVLDAGAGHRAEYVVRADELPEDLPASDTATKTREPGPAVAAAPSKASEGTFSLTEEQLRRIVREAVQEEMLALRADLSAERDKGPGVTEIIGGIGYIAGLAGLSMALRARRKAS